MASTPLEHRPLGSKAAAISSHVVHTISEHIGRGPTKSRTYINDDVVTVVLQETLTKGERLLIDAGREQLVLTTRKAFHAIMRHDLISGVEEVLGREVAALLSDNHVDPDVAVEVFLLAPADERSHGNGARGAAKAPEEASAVNPPGEDCERPSP